MLILLNLLVLGAEVDLGVQYDNVMYYNNPFWWVESGFLVAFLIELFIRARLERYTNSEVRREVGRGPCHCTAGCQ